MSIPTTRDDSISCGLESTGPVVTGAATIPWLAHSEGWGRSCKLCARQKKKKSIKNLSLSNNFGFQALIGMSHTCHTHVNLYKTIADKFLLAQTTSPKLLFAHIWSFCLGKFGNSYCGCLRKCRCTVFSVDRQRFNRQCGHCSSPDLQRFVLYRANCADATKLCFPFVKAWSQQGL